MPSSSTKKKKALVKLSLWTLFILMLTSGLNALFILNSVGSGIFKPAQRSLAAIEDSKMKDDVRAKALVLEVDCRKKIKPLERKTRATSARVHFKNCEKIGRMVNESNHNQGDVFPLNKGLWTSDFIALSPGKNAIKAPIGKAVQVINITREAAQKTDAQKDL